MTEASRRRWVLLATLLGMLLTGRLGWWQLDRAAQKQSLQDAVSQSAQAERLNGNELAGTQEAAAAQWHRPVVLQGEWMATGTLFLDNRQMGGRPGFFVVTPLRLADGSAVLVQRGWVPRDVQDRRRLPDVPTPSGVITLVGRVAPWPSHWAQLGEDETGPIRQNVEPGPLQAVIGTTLRPLSVVQLDRPGEPVGPAADDGLWRNWPEPASKVPMHQGYAAQWFAFCALIGGLYVWFQLIRPSRALHA